MQPLSTPIPLPSWLSDLSLKSLYSIRSDLIALSSLALYSPLYHYTLTIIEEKERNLGVTEDNPEEDIPF